MARKNSDLAFDNRPPVSVLKLNNIPKGDIKFFLSYFKGHMGIFIADLIFAVMISFIDLSFPVLSRFSLNRILPNYDSDPSGTVKAFTMVVVFGFLLYILRTVGQWFITYFGHVFGVYVETAMREDIFRHIENQSFSFFDKNRTGKIMSRASTDLFEVSELAHHGPEDLLISFLTLGGAFVIMFRIQWQLALIVFLALPTMIICTQASKKFIMRTSKNVKGETAGINTALESSISGARVTKIFTNEEYEIEKFEKSNKAFLSAKKFYYKAMARFHSQMDFATHSLNIVVLAVGGYFIIQKKMTYGDLIAANMFVAAFLQPIRRLTNFVEQFSTGMAGFMRFSEVMRSHEETPEAPDAVEIKNAKGDISYKNVTFSYGNGINVIENISFDAPAGKTIALVGSSGSGKTTLCHLLPRFYDYTEGEILLDGTNIKNLTLKSLRQQIGFVQQDVFLFAGSVRENIAYGKPDATMEEIIAAAKRAEIYDDVLKMPDGFDTVVGERGIKLSGGQKQRVAIARVFLKNPPILVLDEATSALDSVTELKIQHSFDELSKGRTTFIIAHRLSTIRNADSIIVVGEKGISESGTHQELMEKKGEYYNLYTTQMSQIASGN